MKKEGTFSSGHGDKLMSLGNGGAKGPHPEEGNRDRGKSIMANWMVTLTGASRGRIGGLVAHPWLTVQLLCSFRV